MNLSIVNPSWSSKFMRNKIKKKFRSFKSLPVFFKFQILLKIVSYSLIQFSRFFVVALDEFPKTGKKRWSATLRLATKKDIPALCHLEDKEEIYKTWLNEGHDCVIALDGSTLIGFIWISRKDHIEKDFTYKLSVPKDSVYLFDAYIDEQYRLRGIWVQFLEYVKDLVAAENRSRYIGIIDYGNDASLKAHVRFGFSIVKDIFVIRLFKKSFFFQRNVEFNKSKLGQYLS